MMDHFQMEQAILDALGSWDKRDLERVHFLMERASETPSRSIRSRVAGVIVALGLLIDPEAVSLAPRRMAMEVGNVRD